MSAIYLDHAATTAPRPEVLEAMWPFFEEVYGNPSSVYGAAAGPREALERAHAMVAGVLGCRPGEIIFTSGGTESDNLALFGAARALQGRGRHVITSQVEHHAVLRSCEALQREGFRVTYLPVDREGRVDPRDLEAAIEKDTILVSIMLANNEIGTIQPIPGLSAITRRRGILFHTDAVQAAGTLDLDVDRLGVDLLSVSAHKVYGPKGVGALYMRRGTPLQPLLYGGNQERGHRSGTENVPGAVGLAVALSLAAAERETEAARMSRLRDRLIDAAVTIPDVHLTGARIERLPGHASFYLERVSGESVLVNLDMAGIACSSGSACQAGSTDPSHVLTAIGLPARLAKNGLRLTLGRENTEEDVDTVARLLPGMLGELRPAGLTTV